ncbi:hypothetical protein JXL19_10535 [bacterium]|nr:hypothetical protein [bacterium]
MKYTIPCFLSGILGVLLLCHNAPAEIYGQFTGWKACSECHSELRDGWLGTRHAGAFESLSKSGQQDLPDCLRCHVVGYGQSGGFLDPELTMELSGVQCESCHGPGKRHSDMPEATGSIIRAPAKDLCLTCHTRGQDPNFDYQKKIASIHGEEAAPPIHRPTAPLKSPSNLKLHVDKTVIELESVNEGVPVIANVFLKNTGENDIRITDLVSS